MCKTAVWKTTKGAVIVSSMVISMAYDWSCGTAGIANKSVERTKKLPWNDDMRRSIRRELDIQRDADEAEIAYFWKHGHA